jgi:Leucine-rich repeat (LRR) protein
MADSQTDQQQHDKFAFGGFFPIKRLKSKFTTSNGGEWLVAYKAEQRRRLNAVLTTFPDNKARATHKTFSSEESDSSEDDVRLSRGFILAHMHVDDPLDVVEMNITGCDLEDGDSKELQEFVNVIKVQANDNKLAFELFDNFKNLKELEIALNGISRMDLACQSFPSLQVVDLSYNSLSDQAILALGILPALKELHLSGNSLVLLPAEMSRPHHPEPNKSEHVEGVIVRYPRLEKLWLDDNRLTDLSTFAVLAGLKRLKELYLDNNEIYCIPYLKLLGLNQVEGTPAPSTRDGRYSRDSVFTPVETSVGTPLVGNTAHPHCYNQERNQNSSLLKDPPLNQPPPPFPQLEMLSLSNNLILTADGLLPVKDWPSIKEVRIHGNPLTYTNKGMPPLIQQELAENGNIRIIRKLSELQKPTKPSLAERSKQLQKVPSSLPPLIPRQPVLPALEMGTQPPIPALPGSDHPPLPPLQDSTSTLKELVHTDQRSVQDSAEGGQLQKQIDKPQEVQSGVFLTQVNAEQPSFPKHSPDKVDQLPTARRPHFSTTLRTLEQEDRDKEGTVNQRVLPQRYKGYEALLDAQQDHSLAIPSDIQGCTKALRQVLNHPLMLPSPKKAHLSAKQLNHPPLSPKREPTDSNVSSARRSHLADQDPVMEEQGSAVLPAKVRQMESVLSDIKHQCLELEMSLSKCGSSIHHVV